MAPLSVKGWAWASDAKVARSRTDNKLYRHYTKVKQTFNNKAHRTFRVGDTVLLRGGGDGGESDIDDDDIDGQLRAALMGLGGEDDDDDDDDDMVVYVGHIVDMFDAKAERPPGVASALDEDDDDDDDGSDMSNMRLVLRWFYTVEDTDEQSVAGRTPNHMPMRPDEYLFSDHVEVEPNDVYLVLGRAVVVQTERQYDMARELMRKALIDLVHNPETVAGGEVGRAPGDRVYLVRWFFAQGSSHGDASIGGVPRVRRLPENKLRFLLNTPSTSSMWRKAFDDSAGTPRKKTPPAAPRMKAAAVDTTPVVLDWDDEPAPPKVTKPKTTVQKTTTPKPTVPKPTVPKPASTPKVSGKLKQLGLGQQKRHGDMNMSKHSSLGRDLAMMGKNGSSSYSIPKKQPRKDGELKRPPAKNKSSWSSGSQGPLPPISKKRKRPDEAGAAEAAARRKREERREETLAETAAEVRRQKRVLMDSLAHSGRRSPKETPELRLLGRDANPAKPSQSKSPKLTGSGSFSRDQQGRASGRGTGKVNPRAPPRQKERPSIPVDSSSSSESDEDDAAQVLTEEGRSVIREMSAALPAAFTELGLVKTREVWATLMETFRKTVSQNPGFSTLLRTKDMAAIEHLRDATFAIMNPQGVSASSLLPTGGGLPPSGMPPPVGGVVPSHGSLSGIVPTSMPSVGGVVPPPGGLSGIVPTPMGVLSGVVPAVGQAAPVPVPGPAGFMPPTSVPSAVPAAVGLSTAAVAPPQGISAEMVLEGILPSLVPSPGGTPVSVPVSMPMSTVPVVGAPPAGPPNASAPPAGPVNVPAPSAPLPTAGAPAPGVVMVGAVPGVPQAMAGALPLAASPGTLLAAPPPPVSLGAVPTVPPPPDVATPVVASGAPTAAAGVLVPPAP